MAELLSRREADNFLGKVNVFFGASFDASKKFFSKKDKEELRFFMYSGGPVPDLKSEWIGLHVATVSPKGLLPTIEGAQILGPEAERGIISVSRDVAEELMSGVEVKTEDRVSGSVLIESCGDFICGGVVEDGLIKPYVPRSRRLGE